MVFSPESGNLENIRLDDFDVLVFFEKVVVLGQPVFDPIGRGDRFRAVSNRDCEIRQKRARNRVELAWDESKTAAIEGVEDALDAVQASIVVEMELERANTQILLRQMGNGDSSAKGRLLEGLYLELRGMADRLLSRERSDHILQPTALVHEAFLKLVDQTAIGVNDAAHFKAVAARSMRQVLVDYARSEGAAKRGGGFRRLTLTGAAIAEAAKDVNPIDLMALEEALVALAAMDMRKAQVVELRFFGGLSIEEAAAELGVARATIADDWKVAKAWLAGRLGEGPAS